MSRGREVAYAGRMGFPARFIWLMSYGRVTGQRQLNWDARNRRHYNPLFFPPSSTQLLRRLVWWIPSRLWDRLSGSLYLALRAFAFLEGTACALLEHKRSQRLELRFRKSAFWLATLASP